MANINPALVGSETTQPISCSPADSQAVLDAVPLSERKKERAMTPVPHARRAVYQPHLRQ
jgi:hypothetical protein